MISYLLAAPLAFLVGVSLGLLGGGGSILTVPILVYVLHVAPKSAIATSLVVVGLTALVGSLRHGAHGNVAMRTGLGFGMAGILGAWSGSRLAAQPFIPGNLLLIGFAVLMIVVAVLLLRDRRFADPEHVPAHRTGLSVVELYGFLTGCLTGLLGVGGGFIIMPVLHIVAGLPVHRAVGTSLLVIAMNCVAGLLGYLGRVPIHWTMALAFAAASIAGSWFGANWSRRISPHPLRRAFAAFILLAGVAMIAERGVEVWGR